MLSVGSRDGRKRSGLGLGMEEAELEEGEALNYHQEDEDSAIDPDVALSYIEEKLQSVLGHFQKDFEGGVSAENLGAKFGGYGSFLPAYQRSPVCSHARSPAAVPHYDAQRSPRNLNSGDQRHNSRIQVSASPSARPSIASVKSVSAGRTSKGGGSLISKHAEESNLKGGVTEKSVNHLKLRIKVGSENLATQKNVEIYDGLGLVVTPSSSLDDSPTTDERQHGQILDMPDASPTSILQIMTSYSGVVLLSPLSEDLIRLTETRKPRMKHESKNGIKTSIGSSGISVNGHLSNKSDQKEPKKMKSAGKYKNFAFEPADQNSNENKDKDYSLLKREKEMDIDALGCEELVSNTLKLPLLSSSGHNAVDSASNVYAAAILSPNASKDGTKGETLSTSIEKEHIPDQDIGRVGKWVGMPSSLSKVPESKKEQHLISNTDGPVVDMQTDGNVDALDLPESNGKTLSSAESFDNTRQLVVQSGGVCREEGFRQAVELSSSGGMEKQNVDQAVASQDGCIVKDELIFESSVTPKCGKYSSSYFHEPKNDSQDLHKDHVKSEDRYKDFFGDIEFEDADDESLSGEMTSSGRLKDPHLYGKSNFIDDHSNTKEKSNHKTSEKPFPKEKNHKPTSHMATHPGNGPSTESPTGMVPLVNEDWVSCDKCQKWRLLPLGTNPKSLPDKWLCRMLTWLPGMNRCSIPEEHTTNALRALYHTPVPVLTTASESQHIQHSNSVVTSIGIATVGPVVPGQEHQSTAVQTATKSGKKMHGSAEATNSTDVDDSTRSSSSRKKSFATNVKASNLNRVNNSPSPDACGYQHPGRANSAVEKCGRHKAKMSIVSCSDGGTDLNVRGKQGDDMEGPRASKRVRSEEMHFDDENWMSDNGGTSSKGVHVSTSLTNHTPGNDRRKHRNRKDVSGPSTSNNDALHSGKFDDKDIIGEPISSSGKRNLDSLDVVRAAYESDRRKEKRARVSKSGKDISGRKNGVEADWKIRTAKDQHNGLYVDNIQSDPGPLPSSVAANSSSSKVSGSHKNRTGGQEVKGSPVESVSSSPLRFLDADKVSSAKNNFVRKDDFDDCGFPSGSSPRRLSDDGGGDGQTGMMKTDEISGADTAADANVHSRRSSLHSSAKHFSEQCNVEAKTTAGQSRDRGSYTKKPGKGLSSHFKDISHASGSHLDKVGNRISESSNDSLGNLHMYEEKSKSRRNKSNEKSGTPSKVEKLIIQKDTAEGIPNESGRLQTQRRSSYDGRDTAENQDKKHNILEEHDKVKSQKSNHTEAHRSVKSHSLPPLARVHADAAANGHPVSGSQKESGKKSSAVDEFGNGNASNALNQKRKVDTSNVGPIRLPTPTSHKVGDADAPSPIRRDSSSHTANNALKEAKDLKHMADRLKNSGSAESIGLYFQAALKFLNGASLLESGSREATKHNEIGYSMNIYSSTAKLCLFCAHEYEKLKDMAAAALAYKCVEVAYMRVVYYSHPSASRERNELQTALQIAPPGESPSSSASDVDNLNHAAPDKAALAKVVGSPQVSGSHIITSRNRSGFLRILEFAENVNSAMEASRKSGLAFAAATARLAESSHKEVISSLRKALDYNFHDVEGLLRLVRVAMEAINRESG